MKSLLKLVRKHKSLTQMSIIFFLLTLGFSMHSINEAEAGLPFRVNSITINCSVTSGAFSNAKIEWFDYPPSTTGSVVGQIFRLEGGNWIIKSSTYDSGGPSSSGVSSTFAHSGPGSAAYYQGKGRTWLNGTWPVDLTSGTKYCS